MSIEGLGSPYPAGISGVSGQSRTEEERRHSRKISDNAAALDPRSSFDTSLDAMLGEDSLALRNQDRFTHEQNETPATYNAAGRMAGARTAEITAGAGGAQTTTAAQTTLAVQTTLATGATLASEPTVVPQGVSVGTSETNGRDAKGEPNSSKPGGKSAGELSSEEQKQVELLRQRDQEVRTHEQAHQATGGEHAGGISYTYQRGPDNRQYAIGGSVPIDVSPVADDPEATIAKAEKVRAAAMAPASPSGADQQVASKASQMAAQARAEQAEKALNPEEDEKGLSGKPGKAGKADKTEISDKPVASDQYGRSGKEDNLTGVQKAEKAAEAGLTSMASAEGLPTGSKLANGEARTNTTSATNTASETGAAEATNPLHRMPPRPAEASEESPDSRNLHDTAQPSARATAAYAALQQMSQATGGATVQAAASSDQAMPSSAANPEIMRRAMGKASAAYTRVRGETGLAPLNTGISVSV